jgi:hypothetical protein
MTWFMIVAYAGCIGRVSLRKSKMGADSDSYLSVMIACEKLLDHGDERSAKIAAVFSQCAADEHVNRKILLALKRFLSPDEFQELSSIDPNTDLDMKKIPEPWQRNAISN